MAAAAAARQRQKHQLLHQQWTLQLMGLRLLLVAVRPRQRQQQQQLQRLRQLPSCRVLAVSQVSIWMPSCSFDVSCCVVGLCGRSAITHILFMYCCCVLLFLALSFTAHCSGSYADIAVVQAKQTGQLTPG
jgi:hypothetical protein